MKHSLFAAAVAAISVFLFSVPANAQFEESRYYLKLGGGIVSPDIEVSGPGGSVDADLDTGFAALAAFGTEFGGEESTFGSRIETEMMYRGYSDTSDIADIGLLTTALNLMMTLNPQSNVTPYLGGGVGISLGFYEEPGFSENDTALLLQGLGGVVFGGEKIGLDLGARYMFSPHELGNLDADVRDLVFTAAVIIRL